MNKKIFFILTIFTFIGLFFHFLKINQTPPCLNADELAFSYNSYSLLKTAKDEFGKTLPLRLTSFGDYIKGNFEDKKISKKLYYLPNCAQYEYVIVEKDLGEQWFCDEKEAIKAGYKKAKTCK